jgi:hypothetical protein
MPSVDGEECTCVPFCTRIGLSYVDLVSLVCIGMISGITRYHVDLISPFKWDWLTFSHTVAKLGDGKRIILIGRGRRTSGDMALAVLCIRLFSAGDISLTSGCLT